MKQRMMRNPERWIGYIPTVNFDQFDNLYDTCDMCRCFYEVNDLWLLLTPITEEDWALQEKLNIEEAESFCPACLSELEIKADTFYPDWREK